MYKIGDKVVLKKWKALKKEFGLDGNSNIDCKGLFTLEMRDVFQGTDRVVTIKEIRSKYDPILYGVVENSYSYHDDMILGYAFQPGEVIEVRGSLNSDWIERKFARYDFSYDAPPFIVEKADNKVNCAYYYARKFQQEERAYWVGQKFQERDSHDVYLLAEIMDLLTKTARSRVALINLDTGRCWSLPREVHNVNIISQSELNEIVGDTDNFTLL